MPSFDGETLTITLDSGVTSVDVLADIYTPWKTWQLSGDNLRYPQAFRSDGGNPLTTLIDQGAYIFLQNNKGWRIKPPEEDITIYLVGNLAVEDTALDAFNPTTGAFTAAILGLQPITQGVSQVLIDRLNYNAYQNGVTYDFTNGDTLANYILNNIDIGGSQQYPLNNLDDVITVGAANGTTILYLIGDLDAGSSDALTGWKIIGTSTENHVHLDPGSTFTNCAYHDLHIHGDLFGTTQMHDCEIGHITGFAGELMYCTLEDKIEVATGQKALLFGCFSAPDAGTAEIDCGGTGVNAFVEGHNGSILVSNVTTGMAHIHMQSGKVTLAATCSGGMVMVADGTSLDASLATCAVDAENLISHQIRDVTYAIESARKSHKAFGQTFYVEVTDGLAAFDGTTEETPKATIAQAEALCESGRGDIIQVINKQAGAVVHTEDVVTAKNGIHFRLPDRDFEWRGTANGTILTVDGDRCSLEGGFINSNNSSDYGIVVNGHQFLLIKPWIKRALVNNILYRGGSYHELIDGEIEKAAGPNIRFFDAGLPSGAPREVTFIGTDSGMNVYDGGDVGIAIDDDGVGPAGSSTRIVRLIGHCNIHDHASYGITAGQYTTKVLIGRGTHVHNNNGGHDQPQFNLLGEVHNELVEGPEGLAAAVWAHDIRTTPGGEESAGKVVLDANKILRNKVVTDPVGGTFTVYDDDNTVLFTGPLWENVAATQPYRGQGAENRERMA